MTALHIVHAIWQTLRVSAPTIVEAMRGTLTPEACDRRLAAWSAAIVERAHIDLSVEGSELAPPAESFVLMSNHQSLYDVPVIFHALQRRIRMVAKQELFRVPVWGRAMRSAGFIALDRENRDRSRQSLQRSAATLRDGTSIWIAPEGTRSRDGSLGVFRKGGFHLAVQSGCRILPLSIVGTREVLPAKGLEIRDGRKVRVVIHPPIDPLVYGEERREELIAVVRQSIASALPPVD